MLVRWEANLLELYHPSNYKINCLIGGKAGEKSCVINLSVSVFNRQGLALLESLSLPVPLPLYMRPKSPAVPVSFLKPRKCRRSRTVFSEWQLSKLEQRFETQKYLSTPERSDLAEHLGLSQIQIKTWFQNRRMKWKKTVIFH